MIRTSFPRSSGLLAVRPLRVTVIISVVVCALLAGSAYAAWEADFFSHDTGGQALVEPMAIAPAGLYDPDSQTTFVAFQGPDLDPYVAAYSHATSEWEGPYRVGKNKSLQLNRDLHGAPSLVMDSAGYLHVFYGAHGTYLYQAVSPEPHSITPEDSDGDGVLNDSWAAGQSLQGKVTYSQPYLGEPGTIHVVSRKDAQSFNTVEAGTDTYPVFLQGWRQYSIGESRLATYSASTPIVSDSYETTGVPDVMQRWYANTVPAEGGGLHAVMTGLYINKPGVDAYQRSEVFYMKLGADDVLRTAAGVVVTATPSPDNKVSDSFLPTTTAGPWKNDMLAAGADVFIPEDGERQNQVCVAEDSQGNPGILFLSGTYPEFKWLFTKWDSVEETWTDPSVITTTDQFFDAGSVEFALGDSVIVYVTAGGGGEALDHTTNRGGNIERWESPTGEDGTWTRTIIREAHPEYGERYNDPQVIKGAPDGGPKVMYCQWDNAGVNFVHKLYLARADGTHIGKTVTPQFSRLSAADRIGTSIAISRESFPLGANFAIIADADDFPDALAGVPFAHVLGAPVLLIGEAGVTPELRAELHRLRIPLGASTGGVRILGGTAAISDAVREQIVTALYEAPYKASNIKRTSISQYVKRISGANRYLTAIAISNELIKTRKYTLPGAVVVASGESYPDALAMSPVAAVNGWPILLTAPSAMTPATLAYIDQMNFANSYIVGGSSVVTSTAETVLPGNPATMRISGTDRYGTAFKVANFGLTHGLRRERLTIASGAGFPDALAGGVLAARTRGPLLLAPPHPDANGELGSGLETLLADSSTQALDWYLLGGTVAVDQDVANVIAAYMGVALP